MAAIPKSLLFGGLLTLLGCGRPFVYQGTWTGHRSVKLQGSPDPDLARQIARVTVVVEGNGRFSAIAGGLPWSGRVETETGFANLIPDHIMNTPIEQAGRKIPPATLKPQKDGSVLFELAGPFLDGDLQPVTLRRESQPGAPNVR